MSIKMVVTDMDGTFLSDSHHFDYERFSQLFSKLQEKGIEFVAASGSQYQRLYAKFQTIAPRINFICQNGATIYDGHTLVYRSEIDMNRVTYLIKQLNTTFSKEELKVIIVLGAESGYVEPTSPDVSRLIATYYPKYREISDLSSIEKQYNDQIVGLAMIFTEGLATKGISQRIKKILGSDLSCLSSGFNFQLVQNREVDKSMGVDLLADRYQIEKNEILVFGNNDNDFQMLNSYPVGFVMPNAPKYMKKKFPVLKLDNNHSGVIQKIESLL